MSMQGKLPVLLKVAVVLVSDIGGFRIAYISPLIVYLEI